MKLVTIFSALLALLLVGCEQLDANDVSETEEVSISMTFKGPLYEGNFYEGKFPATGYAVWVEDANGVFVKTLAISTGIVEIGLYGAHTNHLPAWEASSGIDITATVADAADAYVPQEFDGITGASPDFTDDVANTTLMFTWDFTDNTGSTVTDGTYHIHAEAGNIQKNTDGTDNPPVFVVSESIYATIETVSGNVVPATGSANITALSLQ